MSPNIKSKCIGFRVTESQFARLQALASEEHRPLGEWCRELVFETVKGPSNAAPSTNQIILEELVGLRLAVNRVLRKTGKRSPKQVKELLARVDKAKMESAQESTRKRTARSDRPGK